MQYKLKKNTLYLSYMQHLKLIIPKLGVLHDLNINTPHVIIFRNRSQLTKTKNAMNFNCTEKYLIASAQMSQIT